MNLISFGVLAADVQRSVTEVHTPQQQLTQTPQSFDARASSSAQNLGAAPNKQSLASVEGDVQTAAENSSAESHSHSNLNNGPSEDVVTARSPGPKTEREFNDFSRQLTPLKPAEAISMSYELTTARSECDTSSKDVETAREITESVRQLLASASSSYGDMSTAQTFAKPTEVLPADVQRSVTEVHAPQQQLTQTPQNFDARASSSAQNLGAAPSKESLAC
uniref:Uncharacterized protein n=1 Tax=Panagrolaimus superbus TaxID=310955 RepID=A0A914YW81_9BILA